MRTLVISRWIDDAGALSKRVYTGTEGIRRQMATSLGLTDIEWEAIKAMYDAEIKYADQTVGKLVSTAESASDRPLVIIITGDHGDLFGEYGLIGHNLVLHDGVTRVPGLVIGIEDVAETVDTVTQHIDLTYTAASLAGISTEQFEGRDIREPSRSYAISQRGIAHLDEYTKHDSTFDSSRFFKEPFSSVRTAEWKYLKNDKRERLYGLPDEKQDVADTHPDKVAYLAGILDEEDIEWKQNQEGEATEFSEAAKDHLEDLGYLA